MTDCKHCKEKEEFIARLTAQVELRDAEIKKFTKVMQDASGFINNLKQAMIVKEAEVIRLQEIARNMVLKRL